MERKYYYILLVVAFILLLSIYGCETVRRPREIPSPDNHHDTNQFLYLPGKDGIDVLCYEFKNADGSQKGCGCHGELIENWSEYLDNIGRCNH